MRLGAEDVSAPLGPVATKICGLTRAEDARFAANAGAGFLGVILAGGPRLLTVAQARVVFDAATVPGRPRTVKRVAVFGEQDEDAVCAAADALDLDVVQLHGARTPDAVARIRSASGRVVWPVVRVASTVLPPEAVELASAAGALVLDALVAGQLGGTGVALDWPGLQPAVQSLRMRVPGVQFVLAGGLRPSSVGMAVRILAPACVDVSSGVEQAPGVKDPVRVQAFVDAVRAAAG